MQPTRRIHVDFSTKIHVGNTSKLSRKPLDLAHEIVPGGGLYLTCCPCARSCFSGPTLSKK